MNRTEKAEVVDKMVELLNDSSAVYVTDYKGVNVADVNDLRSQFRKEGVVYKVAKNTLFRRALDESGRYEKLGELLEGMSGFAFVKEDNPIAPAKIINKYNEDTEKFSLKGCYIEDTYYGGERLKELAKLPSKAEIIGAILGSINNPATGIVGAINAVMRDLVGVVDAISKKDAA
jgi:large subunit ribosomal protein L10